MRIRTMAIIIVPVLLSSPSLGRPNSNDNWIRAFDPLWAISRSADTPTGTIALNSLSNRLGDLHDRVVSNLKNSPHDFASEEVISSALKHSNMNAKHSRVICVTGICEIAIASEPIRPRKLQEFSVSFDQTIMHTASSLKGTVAIGSGSSQGKTPKIYKLAYIIYTEKGQS